MMLRIIMCPFLYVYIKDTYLKLPDYKNYFNVIVKFPIPTFAEKWFDFEFWL